MVGAGQKRQSWPLCSRRRTARDARRVDRGIGGRDRHEEDKRQRWATRNAGEPTRCTFRGRHDDDEQKEDLIATSHKRAGEGLFAGLRVAVAVAGEAPRRLTRMSRGDEPQHRARANRRDHLGDNVRDDVMIGAAPGCPHADCNRRSPANPILSVVFAATTQREPRVPDSEESTVLRNHDRELSIPRIAGTCRSSSA